MCSDSLTNSRFNSQQNWEDLYAHLRKMINFTLNKINSHKLQNLWGEWIWNRFRFAKHLVLIYCLVEVSAAIKNVLLRPTYLSLIWVYHLTGDWTLTSSSDQRGMKGISPWIISAIRLLYDNILSTVSNGIQCWKHAPKSWGQSVAITSHTLMTALHISLWLLLRFLFLLPSPSRPVNLILEKNNFKATAVCTGALHQPQLTKLQWAAQCAFQVLVLGLKGLRGSMYDL